jgi:hypothetical protein
MILYGRIFLRPSVKIMRGSGGSRRLAFSFQPCGFDMKASSCLGTSRALLFWKKKAELVDTAWIVGKTAESIIAGYWI